MSNRRSGKRSFGEVMYRTLVLTARTSPVVFALFLLSSLVFTALLIANLHFIRVLLDGLPLLAEGGIEYSAVLITVLLLGAVNVVDSLSNAVLNLLYEYLDQTISARMVLDMGEKAAKLDLIRFESAELFDGIEKATHAQRRNFQAMEQVVFSAIFHGGYFLILSLYLATVKPVLILGVALSFLPVAVSRYIRASSFYRTENRVASLRRAFTHYEQCVTDRAYLKETRTRGAVAFFRRRYDATLETYNHEMWRTEARAGRIDLALKVLTLSGYAGLLLSLVYLLLKSEISPGMFGAVYFSMDRMFKWFEELFDRLGGAYENAAIGGNYYEFLELPERTNGPNAVRHDRGVSCESLVFRYPGAETNALDDVSLQIAPGETIAIVGENGAGKSTLVRLIAGLHLPESGRVLLDGVDTRTATDGSRFRGLSAVFQNYQRYQLTLSENVAISEPGVGEDAASSEGAEANTQQAEDENGRTRPRRAATRDRLARSKDVTLRPAQVEAVTSAISKAGIAQIVPRLASGLDTLLSREFGGTDLSGGEWQRVAIARGLFRAHDLIVLDEPTAAIDPLEETAVYRMFVEATKEKTGIIVTHRLGSARIADRIIVMDHGRIIEEGTHETLIEQGGKYATMFEAQASRYRNRPES